MIRTIQTVKSLFDVTLVEFPAYDDTHDSVEQRRDSEWLKKYTETPEKGDKTMTEKKFIEQQEHTESRAYEEDFRSMGETRDGITNTTAGAVVHKEDLHDVFDSKESDYDLE